MLVTNLIDLDPRQRGNFVGNRLGMDGAGRLLDPRPLYGEIAQRGAFGGTAHHRQPVDCAVSAFRYSFRLPPPTAQMWCGRVPVICSISSISAP